MTDAASPGMPARDSDELFALQEREQFFRNSFEHAAIGMALVSTNGRFLDVNLSLCRMLGYTKEELRALNFQSITHPEDLDADLHHVEEMLRKEIDTYQMEKRYIHKAGRIVWIMLSVSMVCDGHGVPQIFISQIQDVTAQKKAEAERVNLQSQIQHAQKLESLGVLAGGIAHDFNNLLVGILGNASLTLEELSPVSPVRAFVQQIETAAMRAADLTKQMLAYSGKGRFVIQRFSLSELVEEMSNLLLASISKNVVIKFSLSRGLPPIEADVTQVRQVVMNLITNASEAVADRSGVVLLATGVLEADAQYLDATFLNEGLESGRYVFLEVSDTGCGMDAEARKKIFDPFYTTKSTGRGLGLAAVLGIVRGHRGAIKCNSEPQRGTTFKVLFPAAEGSPDSLHENAIASSSKRGNGLILVVDDEPSVRTVAQQALTRCGFDVMTAENGEEAIEIFKAEKNRIVLVLLDMMMPRLNGEETFRELRALQSGVRVLLSSGYNEQDATNRFAGKGLAGFIQKPYRTQDLTEKVFQSLATHS